MDSIKVARTGTSWGHVLKFGNKLSRSIQDATFAYKIGNQSLLKKFNIILVFIYIHQHIHKKNYNLHINF
jgi:hypothetical protein